MEAVYKKVYHKQPKNHFLPNQNEEKKQNVILFSHFSDGIGKKGLISLFV